MSRCFATAATAPSTKFVVVGGGRMGGIRLSAMSRNPRGQLSAFVDQCAETRSKVSAMYGVETFSSLTEAVEKTGANAAWICAPTFAHTPLIREAVDVGVHVATEKPVAESLIDINTCYDLCAGANLQLFCSFQRRFDPHYLALANSVHSGEIGEPAVVHTVFRDSPCPPTEFLKTGGDPFHDLFVHDIDYVRFLLGGEDPVTEVYASGTSFVPELRDVGVMDTAVTRVVFASGVVYNGEFTRSSTYGYDQRCEVYGSTGSMARIDNPSATQEVVFDGRGATHSKINYSFMERYPQAYDNEVDHFIDALEGKAPLRVSKKDATMATIVSEAALQSAQRNAVVKISYGTGHPEFSTLELKDGQPVHNKWACSF